MSNVLPLKTTSPNLFPEPRILRTRTFQKEPSRQNELDRNTGSRLPSEILAESSMYDLALENIYDLKLAPGEHDNLIHETHSPITQYSTKNRPSKKSTLGWTSEGCKIMGMMSQFINILAYFSKVFCSSFCCFSDTISSECYVPHQRIFFLIKLIIVLSVFITLFVLNIVLQYDIYDVSGGDKIYDLFHELTGSLNRWIESSSEAYNALLIIASLSLDILVLGVWIQWLIRGVSLRLLLAQCLFYFSRIITRRICIFPFPRHYLWRAPTLGGIEFLSLSIPYQKSDDFFFSGHIGFGTIAILETRTYGPGLFHLYAIAVTCYQVFVMLITRGHYTIDMIVGSLVASYFHRLASRITNSHAYTSEICYYDTPL